jgi:hypothetical protein
METGMMRVVLLHAIGFWFGVSSLAFADLSDWQLTHAPPPLSAADKEMLGNVVCGESGFEVVEAGLQCNVCPDFTGNPGSHEGLEIGSIMRGRFSAVDAGDEWLLDTDGCEAHFESFGGVILLGPTESKPSAGFPKLPSLGSSPTTQSADMPPQLIFYKPGFRLSDCLIFNGNKTRNLLVCNEADMAQGEVIGHISVMDITKRGITRWRLLRWYDNSGSDTQQIVSVVPTGMRAVAVGSGSPELQIQMKILETTREVYEKEPEPSGKAVNLRFQRKGQRFFPTPKTLGYLAEISVLTRKMLE